VIEQTRGRFTTSLSKENEKEKRKQKLAHSQEQTPFWLRLIIISKRNLAKLQ